MGKTVRIVQSSDSNCRTPFVGLTGKVVKVTFLNMNNGERDYPFHVNFTLKELKGATDRDIGNMDELLGGGGQQVFEESELYHVQSNSIQLAFDFKEIAQQKS